MPRTPKFSAAVTLGLLALLLPGMRSVAVANEERPPNILVILTDDQGYGDLSAHGNPILKTPNLDRLESESRSFTNFFVSPTCAPTRSALLTGRHEFFNGVTHTIFERERLSLRAVTLAEVLRASGYATGIFGKWHLGDEAEYRPDRRGFEETFIHGGGGIGQTYPGSCGDAPNNRYFDPYVLHNGSFVKTEGYCTDVFFTQASAWIQSTQPEKPFFCWIATNAPHDPYIARPEDAARFEGLGLEDKLQHFYGMIHNIDENVGRILEQLDASGIADSTLVLFMNDNGSAIGAKQFNAGMRGAKGSPWLGGTRANSFWRWPKRITPGKCDALTAHIDVFPTLAAVAQAPLHEQAKTQVQGRDLSHLLANPNADWSDRNLITHVGRWPPGTAPSAWKYQQAAIRDRQYTLVNPAAGPKPKWELYDVTVDPAQSQNLAISHPERVAQLAEEYEQWWDEVQPFLINEDVQGPKENPFKTLFRDQFPNSSPP
jgi:arylsulfatase A-like enzyme